MRKFRYRIINCLFGYERDQIVTIEAKNPAEALEKAMDVDEFAQIFYIEEVK